MQQRRGPNVPEWYHPSKSDESILECHWTRNQSLKYPSPKAFFETDTMPLLIGCLSAFFGTKLNERLYKGLIVRRSRAAASHSGSTVRHKTFK